MVSTMSRATVSKPNNRLGVAAREQVDLQNAGVAVLWLQPSVRHRPRSFPIYISADMEGIAGVVSEQQLGPGGFEYERFREFMTAKG